MPDFFQLVLSEMNLLRPLVAWKDPTRKKSFMQVLKVITSTSPGYTKQDELLKPLAVRQASQT